MIYENITVTYCFVEVKDLSTGEKTQKGPFLDNKQAYECYCKYQNKQMCIADLLSEVVKFKQFTNTGKVSKQDKNYNLIPGINEIAEQELQSQLEFNESKGKDFKRARELSVIVNNAVDKILKKYKKYDLHEVIIIDYKEVNFEDDEVQKQIHNEVWSTIKVKNSHSDFYKDNDNINMISTYYYQVPKIVEKEALELQAIRYKHQNDEIFPFQHCDYNKREIRIADHYNY